MSTSTLSLSSLSYLPLSYASCSLGCKPSHDVPARLSAISSAGFTGIELSMPDLVSFAQQTSSSGDNINDHSFDILVEAASNLKSILEKEGLEVMLLQPFANFEGWPADSPERKDAFQRLEGWTRIMQAVGCKTLQVGSTDTPTSKIGTDRSRFVGDLRELADYLGERELRIAYENWCWSTHAPDWADVWDICEKVDRENFGLCLDTFQSAGGEWADPSTQSGLVEDGRSKEQVEADWKSSCERLARTIPAEKIYLLQISDAYRMKDPLVEKDGVAPRGRWSGKFRPLPYEGYLPVEDFAKAVLKTGFRGWFSYEIFDEGKDGKGKDYDLTEWTKAAMECQKKLVKRCADQE
ncbi:3-dehydroshikimate dehydratase like protein [Zymoseptoria brevis]|uniref:3-dehydroshikimate dehydratase like protein n=1 Tax=Zymoseptoria brevis TaxID=1047168 RepID=A0A0F4GDZ9_9PEZI|nr:3-dehydroshikimate dehydratase like protein [Zymoseptoria brevis]